MFVCLYTQAALFLALPFTIFYNLFFFISLFAKMCCFFVRWVAFSGRKDEMGRGCCHCCDAEGLFRSAVWDRLGLGNVNVLAVFDKL